MCVDEIFLVLVVFDDAVVEVCLEVCLGDAGGEVVVCFLTANLALAAAVAASRLVVDAALDCLLAVFGAIAGTGHPIATSAS